LKCKESFGLFRHIAYPISLFHNYRISELSGLIFLNSKHTYHQR